MWFCVWSSVPNTPAVLSTSELESRLSFESCPGRTGDRQLPF